MADSKFIGNDSGILTVEGIEKGLNVFNDFFKSAMFGNAAGIEKGLNDGVGVNAVTSEHGETALMLAAEIKAANHRPTNTKRPTVL